MAEAEKDSKKPYSGICCEPCWNASGRRCSCKCGGVYHGMGVQRKLDEPFGEKEATHTERKHGSGSYIVRS